jgi:hypothetical protein
MSHTYTSLLFHCIFSTKDRAADIDENIRPQLFAYMTFKEEFVAMLKKHGLEYDEKYMWK